MGPSFVTLSSCRRPLLLTQSHRICGLVRTRGRSKHVKARASSDAGRRWSANIVACTQAPEPASTVHLPISGLNCGSCVSRCERALRKAFGEDSVVVADLLSSSVTVTANQSSTRIFALASACLKEAGFGVEDFRRARPPSRSSAPPKGALRLTALSIVAFFLSVAARRACCNPLELRALQGNVAQVGGFLASLAYIFFPLRKVFLSGAASLSRGALPMNALVLLSVAMQLIVSTVGFFFPSVCSPRTLETLLLLFFVDAGRLLDSALRTYAGKNRDRLLDSLPNISTRLTESGPEIVAAEDLCAGDRIRVDSGERFPVDGIICDLAPGMKRAADQSAVTGEVLPQSLQDGDCVWAGSVNLSDTALHAIASCSSAESEVALSASAVAKALLQKSDTQRLADIAASYLGMFSVLLAGSAALFWFVRLSTGATVAPSVGPLMPLLVAASVLCSACPCGLALAMPLVSMVAISASARQGILFQSGAGLEAAASRIKLLVLDKTGTLTNGDFRVTDVTSNAISEDEVLCLAASAEASSHHPIAAAISRHAVSLEIAAIPSDARQVVGCGVSATLTFRNVTCNVLVGSHSWISKHPSAKLGPKFFSTDDGAQSRVYVCVPELGGVVGCITVADELSASARTVLELRRACGLPKVAVLSGGSQKSVDSVCTELGLGKSDSTDVVRGNLKPREKVDVASSLSSTPRGHELPSVVAVGDGVNDAALLAACEVSIALGRLEYGCAPAAAAVAHVVIPSGNFSLVAESLRIARAAKVTSILSLGWAAAYNIVALLRASAFGGQYLPVHIAALSMAASSSISMSVPILLALYLERRRRRWKSMTF